MKANSCRTEHDFEEVLKKAGLRPTQGRLAILSTLHLKGAQGADELVKEGRQAFDRVTAYRALKQLLLAGIIIPVAHSEGAARYELADHHAERLVCTHCGTSETLAHCDLDGMEKQVLKKSRRFSSVSAHAAEFFGICKQCATVA